MRETTLKLRVLNILKKELPGAFVYKPNDRFRSGIPDILGVYKGRFFAIELKVGKNKATKLQEYTLEQIKNAGGVCCVAYTALKVREFIREEVVNNGA